MSTSEQDPHCPESWIVGLDLRTSGKGAVDFARWLHETTQPTPMSMKGVHVLEEARLQPALRYHHLDELEQGAATSMAELLEQAGAGACLGTPAIERGVQASSVLLRIAKADGAGVLIGRLAPRDSGRIFRLGRTARRVLRSLTSPVIVVPPDYSVPAADAPVVVTTNIHDDSATAMHFGVEFARRTGRPVIALHIIPEADHYAPRYVPTASIVKMAMEEMKGAKLQVRKWLTGLGLAADHEDVVAGHISETAVDYAKDKGAALLVCGSRRLSTIERFLLTSIGSDMAAHAACAVAVVPPRASDTD